MHLTLPPQINSDALFPFLNLLSLHRDEPSLTLDFSQLNRISPAGFSSLTAWQDYRKKQGFITQPKGITTCPIQPYLQRFNLLNLCEWTDEPETFLRRDTNSRFIPLEQIDHRVEDLGERFADCLAPDGGDPESPSAGLWDATWYLLTEMANNVRQHSCGDGFVSAQFTPSDDFVRIAIADSGKGIPTVLRDGLVDAQKLDDVSCLEKALEAKVSTRGQPTNEGVGLTLSSRAAGLLGGWLMIASGSGAVTCKPDGERILHPPLDGPGLPGTLVTMAIKRSEAANFDSRLSEAKELEGLLHPQRHSANFRP